MPKLSGALLSPAKSEFLMGGGIMGELIRSKDWSVTPLGPIDDWPQSLRTTVSLCLASNFPINLIWGPRHIQIYNEGYRPICGGKHPQALGEDYSQTWESAWDMIGEAFEGALAGQTTFLENRRMFLDRKGYLEETFFTFSLSPIRDESSEVGGLFHPVTETTAQMLSQRRTRALQDLTARTNRSKSVREACELAAESLTNDQLDLPFALIYLLDEEGTHARLRGSAHLRPGASASPVEIDLTLGARGAWPLSEAMGSGTGLTVNCLTEKLGPIDCGPYPESPDTALILPMTPGGANRPAAFLILAMSPRLPFTEEYRAFADLAAATLTAALVNARAYEEERERAEKLAELDRAKTEFFSNVSHEFRTPLTLILGPLEELLALPGEEFTAKRDAIASIQRNSLRLLRLVNTLLDFSRIEADRIQAAYQPIDLAAYTRDLASNFRSVVEKAGLQLNVNCPDLPEETYVDRGMWEKIVLNLLSNAFKFTFEGSIGVSLRDAEHEVELAVSDTGTGIPAHELLNVFKRFHRVKGAQGRTYEGTGIGLALVESLVKLHGGTVGVNSQMGIGTTFYVRVPKGFRHLPEEQVTSGRKSAAIDAAGMAFVEEALRWLPGDVSKPVSSPNGRRPQVLLADDNADMRQYIQNILQPEFETEAVADGAQALCSVRKRIPDLVLTDVMMPELDGFGLLEALRKDHQTRAIPVIMLSARAGEEACVEGLQAGADDYLVKPFSSRELKARVRVNLELASLRQQLSRDEEKGRGMAEQERQFRLFDTALSNCPDAVSVFDLDLRFMYANAALLVRRGKLLSEIRGKTLVEAGFPAHIQTAFADQCRQVIRERVALRSTTPLRNEAGQERQYDYFVVPVLTKDGDVEAIAVASRDVTEFIEANKELRAANADLEQFAYSASHDLRAPLRVIDNASKWLEEDLAEHLTAETRGHLDLVRRRVGRMDRLLGDLLEYARIGRTPEREGIEIVRGDALLNDIIALVSRDGFTVEIGGGFADIKVRKMPLQQVLMNLIGNAIKHHNSSEGHILVTVEDIGTRYAFAVKDDGPGIPAQYHVRIFKMFQTLRPKDQVEGSGMGLALVRKWVEFLGGTIEIDSAEGQGSTFRFTFPKDQA